MLYLQRQGHDMGHRRPEPISNSTRGWDGHVVAYGGNYRASKFLFTYQLYSTYSSSLFSPSRTVVQFQRSLLRRLSTILHAHFTSNSLFPLIRDLAPWEASNKSLYDSIYDISTHPSILPSSAPIRMHFSLLPATLLVSVAAAQVSTTYSAPASGATACGALPVVDNCLASTQLIANACSPTDYSCLCDKWNVVVVYVLSRFPFLSSSFT